MTNSFYYYWAKNVKTGCMFSFYSSSKLEIGDTFVAAKDKEDYVITDWAFAF